MTQQVGRHGQASGDPGRRIPALEGEAYGDNHMQEQGPSSASHGWLPLKGYEHIATQDQAQGQPHDQGVGSQGPTGG